MTPGTKYLALLHSREPFVYCIPCGEKISPFERGLLVALSGIQDAIETAGLASALSAPAKPPATPAPPFVAPHRPPGALAQEQLAQARQERLQGQ